MDFVVTRVIDAPVGKVWQAWSDPVYVKQWWGPTGFTAPVAQMDFREGGTSLVCMRSPDGHDIFNTWTYRAIVPMERIEFVSKFADENGDALDPAAIGMPPDVPREVPHVVALTSLHDSKTEVTVTEFGYEPGPVLEMSRTGQEQCLNKMAVVLTGRPIG
jgi:uncharacterized protein YndB with AHSA1/START domain